MNILETIAAKTRERTEAEKKQLSLETGRNMAEESIPVQRNHCRSFPISADCQRIRTGRGISHFLPDRTILVPGER